MLKPQDVFTRFETFRDWWVDVLKGSPFAAVLEWDENKPCVPGSYDISISL